MELYVVTSFGRLFHPLNRVPIRYCMKEGSGLAVLDSVRGNVIGLGVGLTQAILLLSVSGKVFGVDGQKAAVELKECEEAGLSLSGLE